MESDLGADHVWQLKTKGLGESSAAALSAILAPLGIVTGKADASPGADIEELAKSGAPVVDLSQDATRYFDLHHTPDDTLDKIDLAQLRQNVAAWVATLGVMADLP